MKGLNKNLKVFIQTYGCQMNEHDSEKIAGILESAGYGFVQEKEKADLILLNTCTIREKSEQKVFSEIGRLKKLKSKNAKLKIGVCGCIAQREKDKIIERAPEVDLVFGTLNFSKLPQFLKELGQRKKVVNVASSRDSESSEDINEAGLTQSFGIGAKREDGVKALVTVMEGCNNFCSYCVVPYVRGPERSRSEKEIVDEIKNLAKDGFREITLLGQNVNSYKAENGNGRDFINLLGKINEISGIERIRFITSHPKDFSVELINAMSGLPKVCEHMHLPVQSGSNKILKLMKRKYTVEEYKEKVDMLRERIPNTGISTDIIVGFPSETEEDYNGTLRILEEVEYDSIYSFKYSPRPQTVALSLKETLSDEEKSKRFSKLQNLQKAITLRKNKMEEGRIKEILVEGESAKGDGKLTGRTRENKVVNFEGDRSLIGKLVEVRIKKGYSNSLLGEIANNTVLGNINTQCHCEE